MGIEYKIKFTVPNDYDPASRCRKLPSPIDRPAMAEIYDYSIEADGFDFVDHLVDPAVAAIALRSFLHSTKRYGSRMPSRLRSHECRRRGTAST